MRKIDSILRTEPWSPSTQTERDTEGGMNMTDEQLRLLTQIAERVDGIKEDVEVIKSCVFGNGTLGLKTQVVLVEQRVTAIEEGRKLSRSDRMMLYGAVIGGAAGFVELLLKASGH